MARTAKSVAFSVQLDDQERLDRLVERFGHGSRTEFLRIAMDRMEVAERAEDFRALQAYGTARASKTGLADADVNDVVRHRLNPSDGQPGGPDSASRSLVRDVLAEAGLESATGSP
jgi:hypothetical protein